MYTQFVIYPIVLPFDSLSRLDELLKKGKFTLGGFSKPRVIKHLRDDGKAEIRYFSTTSISRISSIPYEMRGSRKGGIDVRFSVRPSGICALRISSDSQVPPQDIRGEFKRLDNSKRINLGRFSAELRELLDIKGSLNFGNRFDLLTAYIDDIDVLGDGIKAQLDSRNTKYRSSRTDNTIRIIAKKFMGFFTSYSSKLSYNTRRNSARKNRARVLQGLELSLGIEEFLDKGVSNLSCGDERTFDILLNCYNPLIMGVKMNVNPPTMGLVRSVFNDMSIFLDQRKRFRELLVEYIRQKIEGVGELFYLYRSLNKLPVYSDRAEVFSIVHLDRTLTPRFNSVFRCLETHYNYHFDSSFDQDGVKKERYQNPGGMMVSHIREDLGLHSRENDDIRGILDRLVGLNLVSKRRVKRPGKGSIKYEYCLNIGTTDLRKQIIEIVQNKLSANYDKPDG